MDLTREVIVRMFSEAVTMEKTSSSPLKLELLKTLLRQEYRVSVYMYKGAMAIYPSVHSVKKEQEIMETSFQSFLKAGKSSINVCQKDLLRRMERYHPMFSGSGKLEMLAEDHFLFCFTVYAMMRLEMLKEDDQNGVLRFNERPAFLLAHKLCIGCKAPSKACCSRCGEARYCGRVCQVTDWKSHQRKCKKAL